MSSARIEEVSDDDDLASDPEEVDPSAFDFARPQQGTLQSFAGGTTTTTTATPGAHSSVMPPDTITAMLSPDPSHPSLRDGGGTGGGTGMSARERAQHAREQEAATKHYQCLYPLYFDASRTRAEGRRVRAADAVRNPLARELADALSAVGNARAAPLQIVLEPGKTHPRDWANPGRVRVLVKEGGAAAHAGLANKHHLYKLVAEYLKAHPTTADSPMRLRIHGLPMPKDNKLLPPAVPRGMKMGSVLPLHSPALSGGGVSDNMFKDMMAEMGGGGGGAGAGAGMPGMMPGMPGMPGMPSLPMGLGGGGGSGSSGSGSGGGGSGAGASTRKAKDKKKR